MHGPPEGEGSTLKISMPMFTDGDDAMTMRRKYAPDGEAPCTHPWDPVQYPAYVLCAKCGRVQLVHDPLVFPDDSDDYDAP